MNKQFITITKNALKRLHDLSLSKPDALGIKVGVKKGGCSGLKYTIDYANSVNPSDEVVEQEGVKIFIEANALLHILGTEMDYVQDKFRSEFVFKNPNEKSRCGCGQSFGL
jgi:iron-sulfur cluster assembly protein